MIPLSHKTEKYASHQPILAYFANKITNGKIIEHGVGYYSTPLLHYICQKNNNTLISIEKDKGWLDKISADYPGFHWHHYVHVDDYTDLIDKKFDFSCDLAFLDGYTYGTRLFGLRETLKTQHRFILVHDSDFITGEGAHNEELAGVMWKHEYRDIHPPTLACSMYEPVLFEDIDFEIEVYE